MNNVRCKAAFMLNLACVCGYDVGKTRSILRLREGVAAAVAVSLKVSLPVVCL